MKPLTVHDYEAEANRILPPTARAFISGGAGNETTLRSNLAAFESIDLMPRVLTDVSERSTTTTVLGQQISLPVLLGPSAMHRMVHASGELATAQAAERAGTILVLSLGSSLPVEQVSKATTSPIWFQLYVAKDRRLTAEVAARAEQAGCQALVVTVDAPVAGGRFAEQRAGFALKKEWFADGHQPLYGLTALEASGPGATELWDPSLSWKDLDWLKSLTGLPILLKGILRPDDALRAIAAGVDGIVVSNHGGRQLDSARASVEVLASIVDVVAGDTEVLLDGGVRNGNDVLKALALGARAVLVGRPVLWGLAVDGGDGVTDVLSLLASELDLAMALCGTRTVDEITRDLVTIKG